MPDLSNYDSSRYPNIQSSVDSAATNMMVLSNTRNKILINGRVMDDRLVLKDYEGYILGNTIPVTVNSNSWYRPELVAKDFYGTQDLWWLVLWSGGFSSKLDFVPTNKVFRIFNPDLLPVINRILKRSASSLKESSDSPTVANDITLVKIFV
jgi:hypothetical protein